MSGKIPQDAMPGLNPWHCCGVSSLKIQLNWMGCTWPVESYGSRKASMTWEDNGASWVDQGFQVHSFTVFLFFFPRPICTKLKVAWFSV